MLYLWRVLSLWRMLKKETNNNNAVRLGFKPMRRGILANGHHLQWANNFFRGLAFRSSVSDKNAHRTPNWQMKIEIFENDEVTASDLTRDKNVSFS